MRYGILLMGLLGAALWADEGAGYQPPRRPEYVIDWKAGTVTARSGGTSEVRPDYALVTVEVTSKPAEGRADAGQQVLQVSEQLKQQFVRASLEASSVIQVPAPAAGVEPRAETARAAPGAAVLGGLFGRRQPAKSTTAHVLVQKAAPQGQVLSGEEIKGFVEHVENGFWSLVDSVGLAPSTGGSSSRTSVAERSVGPGEEPRRGFYFKLDANLKGGTSLDLECWIGSASATKDTLLRDAVAAAIRNGAAKAAKMAEWQGAQAGGVARVELYDIGMTVPHRTDELRLPELPAAVKLPPCVWTTGYMVSAEVTCELKR